MHTLHTLLRYYPFWALPLAVVVGELAIYFKRKGKKKRQFAIGAVCFLIVATALAWIFCKGYQNSDRWLNEVVLRGRSE